METLADKNQSRDTEVWCLHPKLIEVSLLNDLAFIAIPKLPCHSWGC